MHKKNGAPNIWVWQWINTEPVLNGGNREPAKKGFTVWSPFAGNTDYFGDASQQYMINYRVENLEALVEALKNEGVTIVDGIENYEYGKFVHILDGEGNRVELWEANDDEYEKMLNAVTK